MTKSDVATLLSSQTLLWAFARGLWAFARGLWAFARGLWAFARGLWAFARGLWAFAPNQRRCVSIIKQYSAVVKVFR
jgi:hypothetical protein